MVEEPVTMEDSRITCDYRNVSGLSSQRRFRLKRSDRDHSDSPLGTAGGLPVRGQVKHDFTPFPEGRHTSSGNVMRY